MKKLIVILLSLPLWLHAGSTVHNLTPVTTLSPTDETLFDTGTGFQTRKIALRDLITVIASSIVTNATLTNGYIASSAGKGTNTTLQLPVSYASTNFFPRSSGWMLEPHWSAPTDESSGYRPAYGFTNQGPLVTVRDSIKAIYFGDVNYWEAISFQIKNTDDGAAEPRFTWVFDDVYTMRLRQLASGVIGFFATGLNGVGGGDDFAVITSDQNTNVCIGATNGVGKTTNYQATVMNKTLRIMGTTTNESGSYYHNGEGLWVYAEGILHAYRKILYCDGLISGDDNLILGHTDFFAVIVSNANFIARGQTLAYSDSVVNRGLGDARYQKGSQVLTNLSNISTNDFVRTNDLRDLGFGGTVFFNGRVTNNAGSYYQNHEGLWLKRDDLGGAFRKVFWNDTSGDDNIVIGHSDFSAVIVSNANFVARGQVLSFSDSVVNRGLGDVRYAQLSAQNSFTGISNYFVSAVITKSFIINSNAMATLPVLTNGQCSPWSSNGVYYIICKSPTGVLSTNALGGSSGGITGSGTSGTIPIWTSGSAIGDSLITFSGGAFQFGGDVDASGFEIIGGVGIFSGDVAAGTFTASTSVNAPQIIASSLVQVGDNTPLYWDGDGIQAIVSALQVQNHNISADASVTDTDYFIIVDTTSDNVTVTLPTTPRSGRCICIKKIIAANTVTIDGNGHNIDGAATKTLTTQWSSMDLIYDGFYSLWYIK